MRSAKTEEKLTNLYNDLKSKLKKLENESLLGNDNLSLIPVNKTDKKSIQRHHIQIETHLKLKCEFRFSFF